MGIESCSNHIYSFVVVVLAYLFEKDLIVLPGWPGTYSVDQIGLELRTTILPLPPKY